MRSQRGFTLLEILAALAIGAFMIVAASGVLVETVRASKRTAQDLELDREGMMILDLLVGDLVGLPAFAIDGSAERFSGRLDGDLPWLDFVGGRDSVATKSLVPSDLTEIGYRLKRREDGSPLYRLLRREDFFLDSKPLEGGTLVQLSDRVRSLTLEYWDANDAWNPSFSGLASGKPPAAVRIRLTLARPDPGNPDALEEKTFATAVLTGF